MLFNKIFNFIKFSKQEKKYFFEALFYLYLIKIKLFFKPLKNFKNLAMTHESMNLYPLKDIKKAIFRANKFSFWKNECLVLCLVSKKMLQKRNIYSTLHLGILKEKNNKIKAHAWLTYLDDSKNELEFIRKEQNYIQLYSK